MNTLSAVDLETIHGGQQAAAPSPTPKPATQDDDWQERWDEQMKRPAPWSWCTGGFWHGCTEADRYR